MQIELSSIDRTKGEFAHVYKPGELILEDERIQLATPPQVSGTIRRDRQKLKVNGRLETRVRVECDRCLQPVELTIDSEFSLEYLTPDQYAALEAAELSDEDLDVSVFDGEVLDIDQIVLEQLLLAIPTQVLCQEDCKGLCPECGANLNTQECGCKTSTIDPRWEALKSIANGNREP